jgi:hypothetical protein
MLPGFRFLFAAVMLSMSLLIFGLGAAALFRAAHESFASNSSWRAAPDVPFAQRPETTLPVLATLRVEPATLKRAEAARVPDAPAEPAPAIAERVTRDEVATATPAETPPAELAKPAGTPTPLADNPPAPEAPAAPATSEASPADQAKTTAAVAVSDAASAGNEPAVTQLQPTVPPAASADPTMAHETENAVAKIATLGGPPVDITDFEPEAESRTEQASQAQAKLDPVEIKKREQARRAMHQRRLAERARLLAQPQFPPNPFAPPPAYVQRQPTYLAAVPRR